MDRSFQSTKERFSGSQAPRCSLVDAFLPWEKPWWANPSEWRLGYCLVLGVESEGCRSYELIVEHLLQASETRRAGALGAERPV